MTPDSRRSYGFARRACPLAAAAFALVLTWHAAPARAADGTAAADTAAGRAMGSTPAPSVSGLARALTDQGFENVTVDGGATPRVGFENRRYRHTAQAIGLIEGTAGRRVDAYERRLGLTSAEITVDGTRDQPRFRVRYPSDPDYVAPPRGTMLAPTSHSVDLVVAPLFAYELGRITDPLATRIEIEPRLRYNPWPGALATATLVLPVHNDFEFNDLHPDYGEVRPGLLKLEQFAWIPHVALISGTAGVFADNRYGVSLGAARPLAGGAFMIDTQLDYTGFIAFPPSGFLYSSITRVSGFGGLTWRPPWWDATFTARASRFLYGDIGAEFIFTRSLGDVDLSISAVRSDAYDVETLRLTVPVPPLTRSTSHPVRVQPVERFPASYRTYATNAGTNVIAVASREDFLRQLNEPALDQNAYRYAEALGAPRPTPDRTTVDWMSFSGMTGFINTPWAGVMRDRGVGLAYTHIPKKWAYDSRGQHVNQAYSATVGVLPQLELSFRFTRIIGRTGFIQGDIDNQLTTDTDHMASARLALLTPKPYRPGLAAGIEDIEGSRRFHSEYLVSGMPFEIMGVQSRMSLGYAFHVFTATRYVLDGGFGAFELSPWRAVATRIEYDSEKWNVGIGVDLGFGLRLRAAALNLETLSGGVGWFHEL